MSDLKLLADKLAEMGKERDVRSKDIDQLKSCSKLLGIPTIFVRRMEVFAWSRYRDQLGVKVGNRISSEEILINVIISVRSANNDHVRVFFGQTLWVSSGHG